MFIERKKEKRLNGATRDILKKSGFFLEKGLNYRGFLITYQGTKRGAWATRVVTSKQVLRKFESFLDSILFGKKLEDETVEVQRCREQNRKVLEGK